ncbi:hypothetical protein [Vibrio sp. 1180_3]|uniref:hypothetical protein n=1 Tax=Vibrio sp. 1180_3 TaxID=2528832 RepID=UPI002405B743|nr:hypothetical protein [Vibrio sp. 1180_3]MDF9399152.1 hypothetical protein [Vibrio sp. 1180_3]
MYNREKRRFAKLIIDKYKELGRSVGSSRYSQEYRRLRDYAEVIFLAVGQKQSTLLTSSDIIQAVSRINAPSEHVKQLEYTASLAISQLENLPAKVFSQIYPCHCGGEYKLGNDGSYLCDHCHYIGRSDQHGFPVSLPAPFAVRKLRREFHHLIREICKCYVSEDEAYQLIAFELKQPLPLIHAGLCLSEDKLKVMNSAARKVCSQLELERAS